MAQNQLTLTLFNSKAHMARCEAGTDTAEKVVVSGSAGRSLKLSLGDGTGPVTDTFANRELELLMQHMEGGNGRLSRGEAKLLDFLATAGASKSAHAMISYMKPGGDYRTLSVDLTDKAIATLARSPTMAKAHRAIARAARAC
ncbi:MAG: hypothetical protein AAF658_14260 [Myxococcota bacterium]